MKYRFLLVFVIGLIVGTTIIIITNPISVYNHYKVYHDNYMDVYKDHTLIHTTSDTVYWKKELK